MEMEREMFLTVKDVARILHCSRPSVYAAISRGEIPARRICGRILVTMTDIEKLAADSGRACAKG